MRGVLLRLAAPLAAVAAVLPAPAAAQPYPFGAPSIGDALRQMDRLHAQRAGTGIAAERQPEPGAGLGSRRLDQVFVLPERPGQNQVSWYEFDWHHLDVESPSGGRGGIRLYFYARERPIAELALPVIRNAYLRLVDQFHYTPTKQIPYILYASKREFQATNVFQVTESVLGVTSPRDLKMSLPYFGDHELFREVSTHELVHQFTIQKLLDLAGDDGSSPIDALPLWFIEGIAEYYAKGGLDPDADRYLRDLVWNPDPERHYEVVSFGDDRYRGYIPTYKLGQARITFIADVYGKDRIQEYLENAALLGSGAIPGGERGFAALTRRVLNEPVEEVDARWRAWLKKRYYPEYIRTHQDLAQLREVRDLPSEPEAFAAAPDGNVLFVRGIDREAGRVKLYLADARYPRGAVEVTADNRPGVESLHPIEHSVMAITDGLLAWSAQSGAGDVLYLQAYRHRPPTRGEPPELSVGEPRRLEVVHPAGRRFVEIWDPAFSPDGRQLAFAAMTDAGQQDVYVVPVEGGTARQLTDDPYAERDVAWGEDGIYCSSDATDHGRFNLFRLDPATGERTRLTAGNWNDQTPRPQPDGSVLFTSDADGKPDVYLLRGGETRRVTDFATGLTSPATASQARAVWASTFYRGRFRIVEVPRVAWLDEPPARVRFPSAPVMPIPREGVPGRTPTYDAYSIGNWRPEAGIVYGGGASYGVAGSAAVLFSDLLRDRLLYLDLTVWGSFDYTQALALFENRAGRTSWALGAFHFVQQAIDYTDPSLSYLQREFGAVGTLRFPLDRFRRVEAELALSGIQRYCLTDFSIDQPIGCGGIDPARAAQGADWDTRNGGVNPQVLTTFRYGYDTVRYDMHVGPIAGQALLLEVGAGWLPWRGAVHGFARGDAITYFRLFGRNKLMLRAALGTSFAPAEDRTWARTWWLTSADNLRGYGPFDYAYLIGHHYYVMNAELQLPLDPILRLAIFDNIMAVAALDFGGVFDNWSTRPGCDANAGGCAPFDLGPWQTRTLTGVLGFNVLFGPLLLRVHFGHPFDIGGIQTPALRFGTSWVTNITLRYFFF